MLPGNCSGESKGLERSELVLGRPGWSKGSSAICVKSGARHGKKARAVLAPCNILMGAAWNVPASLSFRA